MNRRDALKMLAAGTAAAGTSTVISTSTAFADGGTQSFRPSCTPNSATFSVNGITRQIDWTVSSAVAACAPGWTGKVEYRVRTSPSTVTANYVSGGTPTDGSFGPFVTQTGTAGFAVLGRTASAIPDGTNVSVSVVQRRTCTNNANPARKAWCCVFFGWSGVYSSTSGWGGVIAVSTAGSTPIGPENGCTPP